MGNKLFNEPSDNQTLFVLLILMKLLTIIV